MFSLTFGRPDADESTGVAEAFPTSRLVGGRGVCVHSVVCLAGSGLHAVQDAAGKLLLGVAEAELGALFFFVEALAPAFLDAVWRVIVGVSLLAVL